MDICISSNFERFLFAISGDDSHQLKQWMEQFDSASGGTTLDLYSTSSDWHTIAL